MERVSDHQVSSLVIITQQVAGVCAYNTGGAVSECTAGAEESRVAGQSRQPHYICASRLHLALDMT